MAYCSNCGSQVNQQDRHCPSCGAPQKQNQPQFNNQQQSGQPKFNKQGAQVVVVDNGGILWFLLGFCFPIVGLIVYLIYSGTKPNTAKSAGTGALIGFLLGLAAGFVSVLGSGF